MGETAKQLRQAAIQITNNFRKRVLRLERERLEIKQRQSENEAALDATRLAIKRSGDFEPTLGGEFQCPGCWVARGLRAPLVPQASDTDADLFKCRECHDQYSFPA